MLRQRVITAIVLLAVLLGAVLVRSPWPLVLLLTLAAACALWEWLRLTWPAQRSLAPPVIAFVMALAMCALADQWLALAPARWAIDVQHGLNRWIMPLVGAIWVLGATAIVIQGDSSSRRGSICLSAFAVFAVAAAWGALVQLFLTHGAWFLVSLLAMIWFADIGAYFAGKALGRHKLAPRVSPGKTWEGALGGVIASMLWVMLSSYREGSFGAALMQHWSWWGVAFLAAFLAALSIIGDLFESLLKRRTGVKDSSQLLPGHGGVYDRLDALLPVAPIALLLTGAWFS
ncbi:phosphatidate cytidylyltransferase [Paralcaligenes sp. KSB-10]|uniref:phosphatidate cytidylyltransferase n=1 Tax=Paralcaligenes sp. KSB-10 TaxID=2901142 RepID=UPI001E3DA6F1|nr:phosphatidate cytidylyltransferase [Paralcaligenes sp. KSB-10]UHL64890.1 phosphatidate cytidylyltransferase [Paralcaligenes sp. KSB-10]